MTITEVLQALVAGADIEISQNGKQWQDLIVSVDEINTKGLFLSADKFYRLKTTQVKEYTFSLSAFMADFEITVTVDINKQIITDSALKVIPAAGWKEA